MGKTITYGLCWLLMASAHLVLAKDNTDGLTDLTGGAIPIISYKNHDAYGNGTPSSVSRVQYSVRVKNQTGDPLIGDSLILIVDQIIDISGKDISHRVSVVSPDGFTKNGKPFFYVSIGGKTDLAPYAKSDVMLLELDNPDYLRFYPPKLRVRGLRHSPDRSVQTLLDTLVKKGILSPGEAQKALPPSSPPAP